MDSTGSSQDAAATLRPAAKVDHRLIPRRKHLRSSCFARPLRVEFTNSHLAPVGQARLARLAAALRAQRV
jgi:hypothetical protein